MWNKLAPFSSVSIAVFEQVNVNCIYTLLSKKDVVLFLFKLKSWLHLISNHVTSLVMPL